MKAGGGKRREIETLQLNRQAKNIFFVDALQKLFYSKNRLRFQCVCGGGRGGGEETEKECV